MNTSVISLRRIHAYIKFKKGKKITEEIFTSQACFNFFFQNVIRAYIKSFKAHAPHSKMAGVQ